MSGAGQEGAERIDGAPPGAGAPALVLAELLAAKLCHDLAGAVGSLAGTLELAADAAGPGAEALALSRELAASLAARVGLWRAAWAKDAAGPLDAAALSRLGRGLPQRVRLAVDGLAQGWRWPAGAARVLLNAVLLAAGSLPAGGVLRLASLGADTMLLQPEGPRVAWPQGLAALLAEPQAAWRALATTSPREVQAPLSVLVAAAEGVALAFAFPASAEAPPGLLLRR